MKKKDSVEKIVWTCNCVIYDILYFIFKMKIDTLNVQRARSIYRHTYKFKIKTY